MASLHAKHSRNCSLDRLWTRPGDTDGCTCEPTYYVIVRQGRKSEKLRAGKNRREAERALRKIGVELDDGSYQPQLNITFEEWGKKWRDSLERKTTTIDSYRSTVKYATAVFGSKVVRRLSPSDIAAFNTHLREQKISASTRGKHLRVLGACPTPLFATATQPETPSETSRRPKSLGRSARKPRTSRTTSSPSSSPSSTTTSSVSSSRSP